jgi:hypothetical protein
MDYNSKPAAFNDISSDIGHNNICGLVAGVIKTNVCR